MDAIGAALAVARVLDQLCVRYLIGGSIASSLHGEPRSTHDVDFALDLRREHVHPLVVALRDAFSIDELAVGEAVERRGPFQALHLATVTKIDFHVRDAVGFHGSELSRACRIALRSGPGGDALVATPEDMILQKLVWFRDGGCVSDRQWRDVVGMLKMRALTLDWSYVQGWARERSVLDLLRKAATEAGAGEKA